MNRLPNLQTSPDSRRSDFLIAGAAGLALFLLFWSGRCRSFGPGDSAQHALCALIWGVPHPPGYPLQTALGWLWSRLFADPAASVGGLSGFLHAGAAAAIFLLLRREGCRRPAALAAAGFMALSPLFWYYSLIPEVRALNDLLALIAAAFAREWARGGRGMALNLFAASLGLGLSHHPTFVLLLPAFAVWISARPPSAREAGRAALIALSALAAPYALLRLRLAWSAPAYNLFDVRDWRGLLDLFLRTGLGGPLRMTAGGATRDAEALDLPTLAAGLRALAEAFWLHAGPAAIFLAAVGSPVLWKRDRRELAGWLAWLTAAALVPAALAAAQMAGRDPDYARAAAQRFYLLPMIAAFVLSGFGADALAARTRPALAWALAAATLSPVFLRPLTLARGDFQLHAARAMVRDSRPGDLIVLGSDDAVFAALDLQLARGEGTDRVFLTPAAFRLESYARFLSSRHPDLRLPPLGPAGLTTDWRRWAKLNPGRAVLFEPGLLDAALAISPDSVPQGSLIRVGARPARSDPAADARRFLEAPETAELTRENARPWTQEVYLLKTRRRMALWLASRLNPRRDAPLLRSCAALASALAAR